MLKDQTVFIIEDDIEVCTSLKWLFESVQLHVITYTHASLFLKDYTPNTPGCIIVDVRLPEMSGLELLEHLNHKKNLTPVVVLTGYGDVQMAVRAMKLGAIDFLVKPFNAQGLLETVQKSLNSTTHLASLNRIKNCVNSLSNKERQISDLLLAGKLNKEIAYELGMSISTVEAYRAAIMQKMQAKNSIHFIKMYLQAQFNISIS